MACVLFLPVFDKGTSLEFTVRDCGGVEDPVTKLLPIVDLTGFTALTIVFRKPDDAETVIERVGVVHENYTDTDGIIQYITDGVEIDVIGTWVVEAIVTFGNMVPPAEHTSSQVEIDVTATLRNPAE